MASHAAKAVAREVLVSVGKGRRPNITKIAIKKGYSPKTAGAGRVQTTKSYKEEITPLVESLQLERREIIKRMRQVRSKAKYRDLVDGLDKITKNLQLLTGGSTANIAIIASDLTDNELQRIAYGGK